jgi:protein involved in polysaccharide export with SLBB domain
MKNYLVPKIVLSLLLTIFFFQISLFDIMPASSQLPEYTRARTMSVPSSKIPLAGGMGTGEYRVSPGDKITIFVWQNPDLSMDVTIRQDGKLSYPLIGTIEAEGLTIDELQAKLKEKFSEYIKYAQVTVSIKDYAGSKVVVLGEVIYPGVYTFSGTAITAMEAIGLAGDMTDRAKRQSIIIVSDNLSPHPKVRRVNLFMALLRGTKDTNAIVKGGDVVYVPKRFISDFNQFLSDLQPSLSTFVTVFQQTNGVAPAAKNWFWHRAENIKPADGN